MTSIALAVKNIHKSFAGVEVLKGISFEAKKGDVISLIGSSGSGKVRYCAASTIWKRPTRRFPLQAR